MNFWISLFEGIAVSLFGSMLSASFCNALSTPQKRRFFLYGIIVVLLLQGGIYSVWDAVVLRQIYPLVTHLPLILLLYILTQNLLWPLISVLFAYLCCQLRRWIALLAVALFAGGPMMQDVVQLIITLPLLLALLRFVAPSARKLALQPAKNQLQFGVIPALYYVFDYFTVVYTNLLLSGNPVIVEFMPFVCCAAYLIFLLYHSEQEQKRFHMQQTQKILSLQIDQSVREINALRESQLLTRRYRHDLRHHLQYLSACIANGQTESAQNYIAGICREIETQKVQHYCENEAANLILSAFVDRAKKDGIDMKIQGTLPAVIKVSDSDLCVLLSNALENALHACHPIVSEGTACIIDVQFYERDGKFFLQVINPCMEEIIFENGIPVSNHPEHGIGVQSICAIVQGYDGIYTFAVQDGNFILRLSL